MPNGQNGDRRPVVALFGGTGATGTHVIRYALRKRINIRALVRREGSLRFPAEQVNSVAGSLLNSRDVEDTIAGCDAVICVFGPRPPYTDIFCKDATQTIVDAMHTQGIQRLICQTGGMVGNYPHNRSLMFRLMTSAFNRRMPEAAADRAGQESVIINSDLQWTIVKPSRLTEAHAKGHWEVGTDVRLGMLSSMSRGDLGHFLVEEALHPQFLRRAVFIKN